MSYTPKDSEEAQAYFNLLLEVLLAIRQGLLSRGKQKEAEEIIVRLEGLSKTT